MVYLQDVCPNLEVAKGMHDVLVECFNRFLPVSSEPSHHLLDPGLVHTDPVSLTSL